MAPNSFSGSPVFGVDQVTALVEDEVLRPVRRRGVGVIFFRNGARARASFAVRARGRDARRARVRGRARRGAVRARAGGEHGGAL